MGYDAGAESSSSRLMQCLFSSPRDSDFYAELTFHEPGPVECPPESVIHLPVIKCGAMREAESTTLPSREQWYAAALEASTDMMEKSYTPLSVGGDGSATLAMVDAYKRLFPSEELIVLHLSGRPHLDDVHAPLRILLEKGELKGILSVGNRCVSAEDRRMRKLHKLFYMDLHAIYAKGLFCIRDLRNDYPVFLSINADVLDPAYAPGVDVPVSGGLSTRDLLHVMTGIRGPKVVGVDIHGYHPMYDIHRGGDGTGLTQIAMAKIIKEAIVKTYSISTQTAEEGISRVQMMQRQGTISNNPYPDH